MLRWLAALLLALSLTACGWGTARLRQAPSGAQFPPGRPSGASSANPASGAGLYEADCASCHGAGGQGGIRVADGVLSPDIRWSRLSQLHPPYTDALLRRAILDGLAQNGQPLDPNMPRWRGRLTASQVGEVVGYLHTLR